MAQQLVSYIGQQAFSHDQSQDSELEYDRLRDSARREAEKRGACFDRSRTAYESGDGAQAKELSERGKAHGRKMDEYNQQASEFIFRENNAPGRVAEDTIDLHGQFVEEAEDILEERIKYARGHGQGHLHVIVGKGNHSANHVQKLKPRVERVCRDEGLQYRTEDNTGRIYVNLTGGEAHMPPHQPHGQQHPPHAQRPHQPHAPQQQPQEGADLLPKVLRKIEKACCIVM